MNSRAQLVEQGQLVPANAARSSPEHQKHGLTAVGAQIDAPAICPVEREVRRVTSGHGVPIEREKQQDDCDAHNAQPARSLALHSSVVARRGAASLYCF